MRKIEGNNEIKARLRRKNGEKVTSVCDALIRWGFSGSVSWCRKPSRLSGKEDAAVVTGLSACDSLKTSNRMAGRDKVLLAVDTHKQRGCTQTHSTGIHFA